MVPWREKAKTLAVGVNRAVVFRLPRPRWPVWSSGSSTDSRIHYTSRLPAQERKPVSCMLNTEPRWMHKRSLLYTASAVLPLGPPVPPQSGPVLGSARLICDYYRRAPLRLFFFVSRLTTSDGKKKLHAAMTERAFARKSSRNNRSIKKIILKRFHQVCSELLLNIFSPFLSVRLLSRFPFFTLFWKYVTNSLPAFCLFYVLCCHLFLTDPL